MRQVATAVATIALTLALAGPAIAGGWAVTTFDGLPGEFVAGTSYTLGYTIRQHGVTPINVEHTQIVAVGKSGKTLSFAGARDGAVGHYVATLNFPADGTYAWQVTQTPFGPQELGTLVVVAAPAGSKSSTADAAPARPPVTTSPDPVRAALPFAAAAAALLFGWRLLETLRAIRRTRASA
jgi:hypothetical protein